MSTILGSKTGFTDEAGNCLASISKINGVKYLLITTNASIKNSYHILDAINVYDYYSKNYSYKKILNYNQSLKTIKIKNIIEKEYEIKSDNDIYMYLNNDIDTNNLTYEYEGLEEVTKETNKEQIGKMNIKYNNDILYTYNISLNEKITFYNLKKFIIIPITIILYIILKCCIRKKEW